MRKIRTSIAIACAAVTAVLALGTPSSEAATATSALRDSIVAKHNALRDNYCGTSKNLSLNSKLNASAQAHANDMANRNYFSHYTKSPYPYNYGSSDWSARISYWGYTNGYRAENIAYGQDTATEVVNAWWNSSGHRENIIDCHLKYMGVGYNSDGDFWVVDFGGYFS